MKIVNLLLVTVVGAAAFGCLSDEKERCHGNYVWSSEAVSCREKKPKDAGLTKKPDGVADEEDAADPDGEDAEGGATGAISGLGTDCTAKEQCAGYKADYCTANPFEPQGYCTMQNCTADPDNCPPGYNCCLSTNPTQFGDACLKTEKYKELKEMSLCKK